MNKNEKNGKHFPSLNIIIAINTNDMASFLEISCDHFYSYIQVIKSLLSF